MNILQMQSNVLKIRQELKACDRKYVIYSVLYKLTNLVGNIIDAMDKSRDNPSKKGVLISEISISGGTYRTYLTKKP